MVDRLVLHIGTPKTGTTYLQSLLRTSHRELRDAGVLVPNSGGVDRVRMRSEIVTGLDGAPGSLMTRVLDELAAHPGTAVLSEEWLVLAGPDHVARLLEAVRDRCGPVRVEVVVTTRDFTRLVPAAWQEVLKTGRGDDLDHFVTRMDRPRARWGWSSLDPVLAARSWAAHVPADRIHVVVAPSGGGPLELWRRFCRAARLPDAAVVPSDRSSNETLGVVAARLLQEVGPGLASGMHRDGDDVHARYRWLQRYVSHDVLRSMPREPIALRADDHAAVRDRAAATVRAIAAAGWSLTGDPHELIGPAAPRGRHPSHVTPLELFAAAGQAMGRVLGDLRDASERPTPT
ncbi:hypothetical protein ABFT23_04440 [Nocardioides sp. C4-1]|uniref:hypothetical protein n=1 Tax=Nocardioides sp. C4-1 TaxID=3151851 RepID=UPI00326530CF